MLPTDPIGRALFLMLLRDQYERWITRQMIELLEHGMTTVAGQLLRESDLSMEAKTRLEALYRRMSRVLGKQYNDAAKLLQAQMRSFGVAERDVAMDWLVGIAANAGVRASALGIISVARVRAIAELPIAGLGIGEWMDKAAADMTLAVKQRIQMGMMNGDHSSAIARSLVADVEGSPSLLRTIRTRTNALVRTSVTAVSTRTSLTTYEEASAGLIGSYRYVAVRDSRTTQICIALDGRVFRLDDPKRRLPPQHVNCRSTTIPIVAGTKESAEDYSWQGYDAWLKGAGTVMQDAALGPGRAALYRSGKMKLANLVDADTRVRSLEQLRSAYGV